MELTNFEYSPENVNKKLYFGKLTDEQLAALDVDLKEATLDSPVMKNIVEFVSSIARCIENVSTQEDKTTIYRLKFSSNIMIYARTNTSTEAYIFFGYTLAQMLSNFTVFESFTSVKEG